MFKFFRKQKVFKNTSSAELARMIKENNSLVVLDVRTPQEYARDGHIAGARLMPLSTLPARINELPADKTIVCVCRSGARSATACESLYEAGITNVMNLSRGMIGWKRSGLPVK